MRGIVKLAATAALMMAGAQTAQAAFVDLTVEGVLGDGSIDIDGLFGDAGADLSGLAYSVTYHFPLLPGPVQVSSGGPRVRSDCCQAGAGYNNLFRLKQYGVILADQGAMAFDTRTAIDGTPLSEGGTSALDARGDGDLFSTSTTVTSTTGFFDTFDFSAPLAFDLRQSPFVGSGLFRAGNDNFALSVTHIRSSGAIPEPASWALMVAGFGLAGAAIRRRSAISAAA